FGFSFFLVSLDVFGVLDVGDCLFDVGKLSFLESTIRLVELEVFCTWALDFFCSVFGLRAAVDFSGASSWIVDTIVSPTTGGKYFIVVSNTLGATKAIEGVATICLLNRKSRT